MKINGQILEGERLRQGMTKTAFAKKLRMSVSAYCRMIDGLTTKIKTLNRIADILHINPIDLLRR